MFPSPVFDGAKYIGGISKSLANTVWNYFKSKEEETGASSCESSDGEYYDDVAVIHKKEEVYVNSSHESSCSFHDDLEDDVGSQQEFENEKPDDHKEDFKVKYEDALSELDLRSDSSHQCVRYPGEINTSLSSGYLDHPDHDLGSFNLSSDYKGQAIDKLDQHTHCKNETYQHCTGREKSSSSDFKQLTCQLKDSFSVEKSTDLPDENLVVDLDGIISNQCKEAKKVKHLDIEGDMQTIGCSNCQDSLTESCENCYIERLKVISNEKESIRGDISLKERESRKGEITVSNVEESKREKAISKDKENIKVDGKSNGKENIKSNDLNTECDQNNSCKHQDTYIHASTRTENSFEENMGTCKNNTSQYIKDTTGSTSEIQGTSTQNAEDKAVCNHQQVFTNLQLVTLRPVRGMRSPSKTGNIKFTPPSSPGYVKPNSPTTWRSVSPRTPNSPSQASGKTFTFSGQDLPEVVSPNSKDSTATNKRNSTERKEPVSGLSESEVYPRDSDSVVAPKQFCKFQLTSKSPAHINTACLERVTSTHHQLDNSQYLHSKLREVYGDCTERAVCEAVVLLNTNYNGFMLNFCDEFLDPALDFLKTLIKNHNDPSWDGLLLWPVCCLGNILIHLLEDNSLLPGQQYLYIKRSTEGQFNLAVKCISVLGIKDVILENNSDIGNMLKMEWSNRFKMRSDEDLGKLLQKTMSTFEDSIQKIKLEETTDSCKDCNRNRQIADSKKLPFPNRPKFKRPDGFYPQMNDLPCSPTRSPGYYNHRTLDIPKTIMDVDYNLLQSGIAILPGCRDIRGGAVIFIFTQSPLWQNQQVSSSELARLFMYYRSVPRDEVRQKGLTIVTDVRGSNSSTVNTLLEAIYLLEGNLPNCISSLLVIADVNTESLVLKSPVYDSKVSFQCTVMMTVDQLCDFIELDQLPLIFHGLFVYCHEDWIRFHMKLDPFLSKLRATAKYLICVIQDLSDIDEMPKTVSETSQLISHHQESVKSALCDQRLISLQSDGKGIISDLHKEEEYMSHTEDFRDSMKLVDQLYSQLQSSMVKLVKLSDSRLRKLEKCLHLREFEEESGKVISWLQSHGGQIAERYSNLADNLKSIRSQQKDFEKFHFSAMSYIEKGNDLLEEASILAQSGDFDDVTGYKELARNLKKHLQDFTQRLEATRERIESTTKCYHLLDKSYEWALEAMKYVASMKMDHSTTLEGLEKLLRSLELYLRHHPAMTEATFASMSELAQKLQNEKLLEQCRVAKARCVETNNLLNLRLGTLRRAKEKMIQEKNLSPQHSVGSPHRSPERICVKDPNQMSASYELPGSKWQPAMSSTPAIPNRAIHPAFRKCVSESTFSPSSGGSFITEDLSDHVVASIPKVLNDITLKSSREDLTEDAQDSEQCKQTEQKTASTGPGDPVFKTPQEPGNTLSSHNRPVKKMLKRTTVQSLDGSGILENGHSNLQKRTSAPLPSYVIPEEDESKSSPPPRNPHPKSLRPISMITASSDSLSSLPEEEDQENACTNSATRNWSPAHCGSPPIREWTPVSVNTHLSEFNRNVPTGPLASLKLSGGDSSKSILAHVMCEMVQTERDYVNSLQYIIENYIPELQREDVPQALRGKRNVIFGNLEKIYQFHCQYFLREVEMCEQKPFQIAHYFLMHENFFYLYALYNKNKPKSDALMAEYGKHFFKSKQEQLGDRMDLASYLLKPVQRMGKYALMLKQIMKECPQSDQAYLDLKAAEQMVKFQLRHGNDLLAMDALRDCDVNLQEQGRLLRQDEFLVWQGRKKSLRHVFLFEDMILFSKTKRNRQGGPEYYVYKHSFKMADIGLTENYGESGYKFEIWFRRRNSGDNYILQAPNSEVKLHWTKNISKVLWNQAMKNRDRHMTEMATMGIGNKPCLDIKPSANNIQDRFINYAVGGRGARMRNSIAVSSFDHSRLNNKRPHSIISIGSTSSSNSSHSGLFMNPIVTGDPFDSPRHTAHTVLSNESGIGTDVSSNCVDQPSENFTKEMSPSHQFHQPSPS